MSNPGLVSLVGAGPGDPGLITVKAMQRLQAADAVVYDRLSDPGLLARARPDAEMFNAGKGPGDVRMTQDEINALLVELSSGGKSVCRLKGGDPFVFGRGGEEALALSRAGLPFEIVPG
ncbi:MAG: HemD protein, partial [Chloroflexi bacterium]|nr:HemD protein [Chloroflexota bacterium]